MTKEKEISCSFCGENDFRTCSCPWHRPFEFWPKKMKDRLKGKTEKEED